MYDASKKLWIHPNVYNTIKQLNICAKKRGTRAGKRKHNITNSSQNKEDDNSFCVGLINVRSVRNKTTELQEIINEHDFDAIAVTETWLTKNDDVLLGDVCPVGYMAQHVPREDGAGGGVALVYKQELRSLLKNNCKFKSFEHMEVILTSSTSSIRIYIIYRPPPSQKNELNFTKFEDEFTEFLESIIVSQGKLLILGDFNIHVDNTKSTQTAKFMDLLETFGLQQYVNQSTHINKNSH